VIVLVAAVALFDDQGRVLLAQRPAGKSMAGLWEFPGGKVNGAETPEECLARELKEELDIRVDVAHMTPLTFASHSYSPQWHLLMPVFKVTRWEGTLRGAEGQEVSWVTEEDLENAAKYPMPDADIPLLAPVKHALREHKGTLKGASKV
jgi:8-oxo-dGTP diphosphatase